MAVDFDSPWKEALHYFLPLFLQLHFPDIAADIDWSRPYEALDTELAEIAPTDASGRWVDKLFKVFLKDGSEQWVLIHVEVQSQRDPEFPERMFEYFYRIRDKFGRAPCSLAVLADDSPTWRPNTYEVARWGCKLRLEFPVVKLLDFASKPSRVAGVPL